MTAETMQADGRFRVRVTARWAVAFAGFALVLAFYGWTAFTNARTFPHQMDFEGRSYFNLQTDAFLNGQVDLPIEPAPGLLQLTDPYDTVKNASFRIHDLAFYRGRYYLYWGPTPVLTTFLPARLLLRRDLSERVAAVLYAFGGFLASMSLLRFLAIRYLRTVPRWMYWMCGLSLSTGTFAPFVLRRPTVYEVSITAAFCFTAAAMHLLLSGSLQERPRWKRLAAGGLCLGLAAGARPNLAITGGVAALVLVRLARQPDVRTFQRRAIAGAVLLGPLAVTCALLLAYNMVRFDSFTEFGVRYQLNQIADPFPPGGFGHVPPALYFYVLAPPRPSFNFPFFHLPPPPLAPGGVPPGYATEPTGGIVGTSPIVIMALVALPRLIRDRTDRLRELGPLLGTVLGTGCVLVLSLSSAIYGVAGRYSMDFSLLFLVPALVGWLAIVQRADSERGRLVAAASGAALIACGAVAGVAISFTGATDALRVGHHDLYHRIERVLSPIPTAAAMLLGRPLITEASPGQATHAAYGTAGAGLMQLNLARNPTTLEIVSPSSQLVVLRGTAGRRLGGGSEALVVTTGAGEETEVVLVGPDGGAIEIPIKLRRGLNHVVVRVLGAPPTTSDVVRQAPVIVVEDVRLSSENATAAADGAGR